mgnify:CR=1 FL=1|tara:strand:+ start:776 stop:1078 length:303 start_codon:yes stop_codon:yes gene_type:complete
MVMTKDIRAVGWGMINMNTSWADDYIHDVWRLEIKPEGEYNKTDLYDLYRFMENKMDLYLEKIIEKNEKFDTYDLFEMMIEDEDINLLAHRTHDKVIDEE